MQSTDERISGDEIQNPLEDVERSSCDDDVIISKQVMGVANSTFVEAVNPPFACESVTVANGGGNTPTVNAVALDSAVPMVVTRQNNLTVVRELILEAKLPAEKVDSSNGATLWGYLSWRLKI